MKFLLLIFICAISFSSCDPGYAVILYNRSNEAKQFQVIKPSYYEKSVMHINDSLLIKDISESKDDSRLKKEMILIVKDTINNSFSFTLEKNKSTIVEKGIGWPDVKQKIIINNRDTILLNNDKRVTIKKKLTYSNINISVD